MPKLPKDWLKTTLMAAAIGFLVAAFIGYSGAPRSASGGIEVGTEAPPFELRPIAGGSPVALESYGGQPVLLSFWATWCGPCRAELPVLDRIAAEYGSDQLQVLTIVDEPKVAVVSYLSGLEDQGRGLGLTVLGDQGGRTHVAYGARSLPYAVLIGPDGRVERTITGALSEPALRATISEFVGGPPS